MKHLSDEQLGARLDGEPAGPRAEAAARHLAACAECRDRLAALAAADAALARSLGRDPGEAYFASFADRVQARIARAADGTDDARAGLAPGRPGWFSRPATLAWAGSIAALALVGVFAIRFASQEASLPKPVARQAPLTRAQRSSPPLATPPTAAPTASRAAESAQAPDHEAAPAPPAAGGGSPAPLAASGEGLAEGARASEGSAPGLAASGDNASQPQERAQSAAQRQPPAPAGRLQELRTLPNGEQVPVQQRTLPGANARKDFAAPPAEGQKFRKPAAQPLAPQPGAKQPARHEKPVAGGSPSEAKRIPAAGAPAASAPSMIAEGRAGEGAVARDEARGIALRQVCGTVRDAQGRPLEGATVTVVENGRAVRSGPDGAFCVEAPPGGGTLSVLALGYGEHREKIAGNGPVAISLRAVETVGSGEMPLARLKTVAPPGIAGESSRVGPDAPREKLGLETRPGGPPPTAAMARAASAAARLAARAPLWTRAGELWAAVAAAAKHPADAGEARFQAAEARMHAWRLAPDGPGRAAALAAVEACLAGEPAGMRRTTALAWKRELSAR